MALKRPAPVFLGRGASPAPSVRGYRGVNGLSKCRHRRAALLGEGVAAAFCQAAVVIGGIARFGKREQRVSA